jgi:hypothetical protein
MINKVDVIPNVPCTKITGELSTGVRKVTEKMFEWSDTGENATDYTNSVPSLERFSLYMRHPVCVCVCV